jgi:hypothetical protein
VPASGVEAAILNVTAVVPSAAGFLTVYPADALRPEASSLNFSKGQVVANLAEVPVPSSGAVDIYNGSDGSTNVVVDIEGYVTSGTGALYSPLSPVRICDTRAANPSGLAGQEAQCGGETLQAGRPLRVQVTGVGGVPASASAAVVNLTVPDSKAPGYLTAYPAGGSVPLASNMDFPEHALLSNRAIVVLSSSGGMNLVANVEADVIVDVSGYFDSSGASYTAMSPVRIADTRCGENPEPSYCGTEQLPHSNAGFETLGPGQVIAISVSGVSGVPITATAAVLNVTATDTTASSYLTAYPAGTASRPMASDLNWFAGSTVPNLVVVGLGNSGGGGVDVFNYDGGSGVVVDLEGYYS